VTVASNGNQWQSNSYNFYQFTLTVQNTGSQIAQSALGSILFQFGNITQFWNCAPETEATGPNSNWVIELFDLQPGQTYTGAGFTWELPSSEENLYTQADASPYAITVLSTSC